MSFICYKVFFILILFNCSIKKCFCLEKRELNDTSINFKSPDESSENFTNINNDTADSVQSKGEQANAYTCPYYTLNKEKTKKELGNFLKDSYETAVDLCNTSSRVGCKYSDFLNLVSECLNEEFFSVNDVIDELNENKELNELPQINNQTPVIGFVSFKIVNVDAVSIVHMDFKIDFYLAVTWDIHIDNDFFRKYMARICVSKKVDMAKKQRLLLYQEDMKLFWVPDLYFPNSKSNAQDERKHLKRPVSRDLLHVSFRKDAYHKYPFLRFVFVTSGHSTILCPMKFDDYPADVQECVVKIRSFYYYQDELKLMWSVLLYDNLQLLEYTVNVSKGQDLEEDHFVVTAGDQNKNFTRLNIHFNFTRQLTHKITGVYVPSFMLVSLNYLTYYFGVNSYSSVRSELPGSSNISGMEIWLIVCFICDVVQLLEASITESIYTNHCIEFYLKKKEKKELETEYLGYSYSVLFDDTSEDEDDYEEHDNNKNSLLARFLFYLIDLISHLILPNFSRKKSEYYAVILDKVFRLVGPILFSIFCVWYWSYLLKT